MTSESRSPAAVHDILHCIISHLDPDPYVNDPHNPEGRSVRQALAQLATTHSTFTQPALSALWRSLPDDDVLKHLLSVVGVAKKVPPKDGWSDPVLGLSGTPETHELGWKRFRAYASLVRKIVVDPCVRERYWLTPTKLLYDTLWCQISSIFGDTPILPSLKVMHFATRDAYVPIDMGALRLFNHSVQELTIEFDMAGGAPGNATRLRTAFVSFLSSTPNLEKLYLLLPYSLLDLESVPQSHPRLRHLRVDIPVNSRCLTSVASLPDLECLSICLSEPVNTPVQFKGLRSLSISGSGLDNAASLITSMDAPRLRGLSIASSHKHSLNLRTEMFKCLHPLAARFPSLTAFDWSCWQFRERKWGYPGPRDPGATLAELIEPLLSVRALRDLSLDLHGPIVPYSSTDFCRMAEAWPDLETLELDLEHPSPPERHVRHGRSDAQPQAGSDGPVQHADYDSFVSFARHCPRLHSLRIPRMRIDTAADIPSLPACSPTSHGLRHLHVQDVLCPEAPGRDAESRGTYVFMEMMRQVFPLATIRLPFVVALS